MGEKEGEREIEIDTSTERSKGRRNEREGGERD